MSVRAVKLRVGRPGCDVTRGKSCCMLAEGRLFIGVACLAGEYDRDGDGICKKDNVSRSGRALWLHIVTRNGDGRVQCPSVANADQLNTDNDAKGGDACDTDDDNDVRH